MPAYSSAKFVPATSMKTTTTHWVVGWNGSIERASVEKPAVAIVGNEIRDGVEEGHPRVEAGEAEHGEHRDLGGGDPDVEHDEAPRSLADGGRERSSGPGDSALNRAWRPPTRSRGSTARKRTMIPTPPSQAVNWRHIAIERDSRGDARRARTRPSWRSPTSTRTTRRTGSKAAARRAGRAARRRWRPAARAATRRGSPRAGRCGSGPRSRARGRRRTGASPRRRRGTARPARRSRARSPAGTGRPRRGTSPVSRRGWAPTTSTPITRAKAVLARIRASSAIAYARGMRIMVLGAGHVGRALVGALHEEHEITVIDIDAARLAGLADHYDVGTVEGDGTTKRVIRKRASRTADLFIGCSPREEANLIAAMLVKRLSAAQTIMRTTSDAYLEAWRERQLDVDFMVSPEIETANAIAALARAPGRPPDRRVRRRQGPDRRVRPPARRAGGRLLGRPLRDAGSPRTRRSPGSSAATP